MFLKHKKEGSRLKQISYDNFKKVDIRVGKIIKIEDFANALNPAYKIWIDFGNFGVKKSSAQITKLYNKKDLINRLIIAIINFPPKQIANFISEVLILGIVVDKDEIVLIQPDRYVPLGKRIL
jgi:tRNA-binding protein